MIQSCSGYPPAAPLSVSGPVSGQVGVDYNIADRQRMAEKDRIMKITEFLRKTYVQKQSMGETYIPNRSHIVCSDGYSFSVQASRGHYCLPRLDIADGMYSAVEIGNININAHPSLAEYADDEVHDGGTVYGAVPVELVNIIIATHGGMAVEMRESVEAEYRARRVVELGYTIAWGDVLHNAPCGCYQCSEDGWQKGHTYCDVPTAELLAAEEAGWIYRSLDHSGWYWHVA